MMATFSKGGMLWAALVVALLAGIVACSSAEPTETGPSAAEIQNIVQSAVAGIDTGSQLTAADVQRIVEQSAGDVLTAADVQTIVQQSVGTQLTAADVQKIINDSAAGQLTASDVQRIVDASAGEQLSAADVQKIVRDSTGQQLTASDVQKIVDASAAGQLTTGDVQKIISASVSEAVDAANRATEAAMMAQKAAMEAGEKALAQLPELRAGERPGFSRVVLPELERPTNIPKNITLAPKQELTYVYAVPERPGVVPPMQAANNDLYDIYMWVFMPAFVLGSVENDFGLRQGWATGYSVSDDGLTYLLHINPDAIFQDGTPITAKAAKDTWEWGMSAENQPVWRSIGRHMGFIEGMKAVEAGEAKTASGLEVVDDVTLAMKLVDPLPTFPLRLTIWLTGMFKAEQAVNDPEGFRLNPIGVGPYRASYDDATAVRTYTATENWWGRRARHQGRPFANGARPPGQLHHVRGRGGGRHVRRLGSAAGPVEPGAQIPRRPEAPGRSGIPVPVVHGVQDRPSALRRHQRAKGFRPRGRHGEHRSGRPGGHGEGRRRYHR